MLNTSSLWIDYSGYEKLSQKKKGYDYSISLKKDDYFNSQSLRMGKPLKQY